MGFVNNGPWANFENVPYIDEYYSKVFGITTIVNDNIAYLKNIITNKINTLIAYGKSTQDGTPTIEDPVAIESVNKLALWVAPILLDVPNQSFGTSTPIDLHGYQLRSLPNGTRDELTVDSNGNVTLTQRVGSATLGSSSNIGTSFVNSTTMNGNCTRVTFDGSNFPGLGNISFNSQNSACSHASYGQTGAAATPSPGVYSKNTTSGVYLTLSPSLTSDSEALTWLGQNPVTFIYPLTTPQIIRLGTIEMPNFLKYITVWFETAEMSVSYQQSLADINSEFISHNSFTNFINTLAEFLETNIVEHWNAVDNCYEYAIGVDALNAFTNVNINMDEISEIQPIEDLQPIDDIQPISPIEIGYNEISAEIDSPALG